MKNIFFAGGGPVQKIILEQPVTKIEYMGEILGIIALIVTICGGLAGWKYHRRKLRNTPKKG